jgi:hypothetical protein
MINWVVAMGDRLGVARRGGVGHRLDAERPGHSAVVRLDEAQPIAVRSDAGQPIVVRSDEGQSAAAHLD